jgi:hypothetical protein
MVGIATASDADIDSQVPLKVSLGPWTGTDANADTITAPAVKSMQVTGDFNGDLAVSGNGQRTGTPAVGSTRVSGNLSGNWTVASLKSLKAGTITNCVIRSTNDIGSVSANSISGSTIFAGVATTTAAGSLPADATAFPTSASVKSVSVKSTSNSFIAAKSLGDMSLGAVQVDNAGVPFGLAADAIFSLLATGANGAPIRGARLTDPSQTLTQGDFKAQVV